MLLQKLLLLVELVWVYIIVELNLAIFMIVFYKKLFYVMEHKFLSLFLRYLPLGKKCNRFYKPRTLVVFVCGLNLISERYSNFENKIALNKYRKYILIQSRVLYTNFFNMQFFNTIS